MLFELHNFQNIILTSCNLLSCVAVLYAPRLMDVEFNAQFRADRDAFVTSVSDTAFNISLKAIKTATARRRFSHTKLNVTTFPQIDLQMKKKSEQCPTVLRITPQSKSVNMFNYGAFCVLYLRLQTKMWGHWVRGNLYRWWQESGTVTLWPLCSCK